jgi:sugar lactone lactonase YvrE
MKSALLVTGSLLAVVLLYLLLWPVPVDPVAWDTPKDRGLVDPFGPDDRLKRAKSIDLGDYHSPEDVALGHDGKLYATAANGFVLQVDPDGQVQLFADVGGRALGIETDTDGSLVVANAYLGLQRVHADGSVESLLGELNGNPIVFANDLAIAADGTIYFSDSSSKFGAEQSGGIYEGSLLDILEHGGHGRIIRFDRGSGQAEVIIRDLNFANGVAISDDQSYLLISDLGSYRILKHWLQGPDKGTTEVLLENLPAFADNINNGLNGRFWIGMISPRNELVDNLSDKPLLRKIVRRLPPFLRPRAERYAHVIAINGGGEVLMNLQDPAARYSSLTGVLETGDRLYFSTLFGNRLPWLDKQDL